MKLLEKVDKDFIPIIRSSIYQEPLKSLIERILPEISFQPRKEDIFKAYRMSLKDIKVVLIGQEPENIPRIYDGYINDETKKVSNSLDIIYRELNANLSLNEGTDFLNRQGVFLLNLALTVQTGRPGSHLSHWESFSKNIIEFISYNNPCIWIIWDKLPKRIIGSIYNPFIVKGYSTDIIQDIPINNNYNYILLDSCKLIQSNIILDKMNKPKIDWQNHKK